MPTVHAPVRVLSTLDEQGKRIRMRPRPSAGRFWRRRGVVAYALIALFVALPFIHIGGRPAMLIDLQRRELDLFGGVFRPSDGATLMLFGLTVALTVFLVTALWGRVWCGWGCPQTVYMEWVFRPLERLIEGSPAEQRKLDEQGGLPPRRLLKLAVFAVLSVLVANVFLAYFVGVDRLGHWMFGSPADHVTGFLVVVTVSVGAFIDFAYFREQMCIVACPYGRLQTVLLDRQSLIVGYDARRGEPRGKAKKAKPGVSLPVVGDCVDCNACVATCPTGIDIRAGLQMECIGCAQCIDACDPIMRKLGRAPGLIRYASEDELEGKPRRILRVRTIVYPILLAVALVALVLQLRAKPASEVWVMRVDNAPFATMDDGRVSSQVRLRIENRSGGVRHYYEVVVVDAPDVSLAAPAGAVEIASGSSQLVMVVALSPRAGFHGGERRITLRVVDETGYTMVVHPVLLGPTEGGSP